MGEMLKQTTECTKGVVMLDGELSEFFGIERGAPQRRRSFVPNTTTTTTVLFRASFVDLVLKVVKALRSVVQGRVGSRRQGCFWSFFILLAADFIRRCVCMSDTPERVAEAA